MSMRTAGAAFMRQERQRMVEAIARIDAAMADLGISARGRKRVVKASRNGTRPVKAAARRRRTKKPVARAANLAAAATS